VSRITTSLRIVCLHSQTSCYYYGGQLSEYAQVCERNIIYKTGSIQRTALSSKEYRTTATGKM